jgi:hypothetical protein
MQNFIKKLDYLLKSRATKPSDCITTSQNENLFIEDVKEQKCVFVDEKGVEKEYLAQKTFTIHNPNRKSISLWAIDGCFVKSGKTLSQKYANPCDCAFGSDNLLCLVEFKLEATSLVPAQVEKNRNKAKLQLESTVLFIRDTLGQTDKLMIENYEVEAYICTPPTYPQKNTAISDMAIEFLETYGVALFEKSEKIIE